MTDEGDEYRTVTCHVVVVGPRAIRLRPPGKEAVWIPRALLHGSDDLAAARWVKGTDHTFRLRAWKAEEIGLA